MYAALLAFAAWDAATAHTRLRVAMEDVAPYEPGSFYRRELPCIRAALSELAFVPDIVVVDGHVWLGPGVPGLGARLRDADPRIKTVVGVAKTLFRDAPARPVLRGSSKAPLYVDECGEPVDAAARVAAMHGAHRIPTLLAACDRLARG